MVVDSPGRQGPHQTEPPRRPPAASPELLKIERLDLLQVLDQDLAKTFAASPRAG
jgi:hypothetical protein